MLDKEKYKDISVVSISYEWSEGHPCAEPDGSTNPECTEHNPTWTNQAYIEETNTCLLKLAAFGSMFFAKCSDPPGKTGCSRKWLCLFTLCHSLTLSKLYVQGGSTAAVCSVPCEHKLINHGKLHGAVINKDRK